jgi:hypothetical protein
MNSDRLKIRLNSQTSKQSVNTDSYLKVNLEGNTRLLPPDIINNIVNEGEQFNTERQNSSFYRILGTINSTMSNLLFNLDDSLYTDLYTWKGFNYDNMGNFRFNSDLYPINVNTYLKEKDGWFGYFDPDIAKAGFCNYYEMEPKSQRLSFLVDTNPYHAPANTPVKNWELTITYPHSIDSGNTLVNNGILMLDAKQAIVATRAMTAIGLPCKHNVTNGDIVRISGTIGYDGDHVVVRTGLDDGTLSDYYFVIDVPPTGSLTQFSRFKKLINGIESTYYFRKFRKIKTINSSVIEYDDYETYKLAFSQNYFNDVITQFIFNEDIDVSNLVDNLGRPLSELYLTIVKTDSNGLFTNVSSGIETPYIPELNNSNINTYLLNVPAINKIHNGGTNPFPSHTPLENNVKIINNNGILNNDDFYGDLVEYNLNELKENILSDVYHRFNTVNRETSPSMTYLISEANFLTNTPAVTNTINLGPRHEGYYYKAHNQIKIRNFSNYIEQGDEHTVGIPNYAINLGDGRYLWRDLLDIGYNETTVGALDYPFLNGCHYMYNNYCFTLQRQDAFDLWGLYYSKYPADPLGQSLTNKFDTNSENYVC